MKFLVTVALFLTISLLLVTKSKTQQCSPSAKEGTSTCSMLGPTHNVAPGSAKQQVHCNTLSPQHCCSSFCSPASSGVCDSATGACFCSPSGRPDICGVRTKNDATAVGTIVDKCTSLCAMAPVCRNASYTDNGMLAVCLCYCP